LTGETDCKFVPAGYSFFSIEVATEKYRDFLMGIMEFKKAGKHIIKVSLIEGDSETSSLETVYIYHID